MSMLPVGIGSAEAGGYQIERSLRFNSADSAYLNRTPASAGNRKTWTWSAWVKRSSLTASGTNETLFGCTPISGGSDTTYFRIMFALDNSLAVGRWNAWARGTTQVFKDLSAWYHIVVTLDTTNATAADRLRVYVNGSQITEFAYSVTITQNEDQGINQAIQHNIGSSLPNAGDYFNGYLTEINFIDGQALTPSSFGETDTDTGVWKPKAYSGSYGTNGFYLKFADNSGTTSTTLGKDSSGNGNNWTPNNFSVTAGAGNDSLVDTPTNYGTDTGVGGEVRGNYATFNPLDKGSSVTLANGNLDATLPEQPVSSTIAVSSGKYYSEVLLTTQGSVLIGWVNASYYPSQGQPWDSGDNALYYAANGQKVINNSFTSYASSATNGDVIGVAVDLDSDTIEFFKNGSSLGSFSKTFTGNYKFVVADATTATNTVLTVNFGQRPFAYTAPSGFKALCTQNLPEPTIKDGGDYFNTVLWTGNGSTSRGITGVGFQPDFVWLKARSLGAQNHTLVDAVRGYGTSAMDTLSSNLTTQEVSDASNASFTPYYGNMQSLNADGFTVAGGSTGIVDVVNKNNETYVAWNWKANGAGSTNTAGTITSTVSVNTTSGFSIVTWTGTGADGTVGHGLGVAPKFWINKSRNTATDWYVDTTVIDGSVDFLVLNSTAAAANTGGNFANAPTSSVIYLGNATGFNGSGDLMVSYVFAPVAGYSAFGSYTGNGSADGPFVYTGFRPAFVMVKSSSSAGEWWVYDTARDTYNQMVTVLRPRTADAENTSYALYLDSLSNGFKIRTSEAGTNASGVTYIYMAFSEVGFKYSLGR